MSEGLVHTPPQQNKSKFSPMSTPQLETSTQRKIKKAVLQSSKLEQMLLKLINKMEEWQEQLQELHTKDELKTWELRQDLKQWIDEFSEPTEVQQFEEKESVISSESISEIFQQQKYTTLTDKMKFIEDMFNKNEQDLSLQFTPQKMKVDHEKIKIALQKLESDVSEMEQTSKKQTEEREAFIERFKNDQEISKNSSVIGIHDKGDQISIIDYYDQIKKNTQEQCRQQHIKELNAYKKKVQQFTRIHQEIKKLKKDHINLKQQIVESFDLLRDQLDKLIINSFEQQEMKLNQVIAKNNSNRQQIQNYIQDLKKEQIKLREEILKFKMTDKTIEEQINNNIKQLQNLQRVAQNQQYETTQQISILSNLDQPSSIQELSQDEMQINLIEDANQLQIQTKDLSNKEIYKLIIASYCQKIQQLVTQTQTIKDKTAQYYRTIISDFKTMKNELQNLRQLTLKQVSELRSNQSADIEQIKVKLIELQNKMIKQNIIKDDSEDQIEEKSIQQIEVQQEENQEVDLKQINDLLQNQIKSDADNLKIDQQNDNIVTTYKTIITKLHNLQEQNNNLFEQVKEQQNLIKKSETRNNQLQQNYDKVKIELNKQQQQQNIQISKKQKQEIRELILQDAEEFGISTDSEKNIIELYMEIKSANKQSLKIEKKIQIQQNLSYQQMSENLQDLQKKELHLKEEVKQLQEENKLIVIACNNLQKNIENQQQQIVEKQQIIDQQNNQILLLQSQQKQNQWSFDQELQNLILKKNHILAERGHYEKLYNDQNQKYNEAEEKLHQYQEGSKLFIFATNSAISQLLKQIQTYLKLLWYKDLNNNFKIMLENAQQIQGEIRRGQIIQSYDYLIKALNETKNMAEIIENDVVKYKKMKRDFGPCELE